MRGEPIDNLSRKLGFDAIRLSRRNRCDHSMAYEYRIGASEKVLLAIVQSLHTLYLLAFQPIATRIIIDGARRAGITKNMNNSI